MGFQDGGIIFNLSQFAKNITRTSVVENVIFHFPYCVVVNNTYNQSESLF